MRTKSIFVLSFISATALAEQPLEEIKVVAHPLATDGVAQSTKVLAGEALAEKVQGSLGETVAAEVGVHSASFGAAVGRPVIHGLGGARVKTTQDRIDSLDVAVSSADHAVAVEPFIADRINILKGASTLLYGSGAIGGVVDVETGRIPQTVPDAVSGRAELRLADNAGGTVVAARLDGGAGSLAWHLDVFDRQADDYDIPGFVESSAFRALEEAENDGQNSSEEEAEARDVLEGSFSESSGGAAGVSFIGANGFAGLTISTLNSEYGLVGGHEEEGEEEEDGQHTAAIEEEEGVGMIDLEQTRLDVEAQYDHDSGPFDAFNFRLGLNDYEHSEIEGSGEVGTLFENEAWEARLQASHSNIAGLAGSLGLQAGGRKFSATGEEAFIPPVESDTVGIFWVAERGLESVDLEFGARVERVEHASSAGLDRDFSAVSASVGAVWNLQDAWTFAGLLDYSSRAPSIEELFSNGPHLATQSFEIGEPDLRKEQAAALTLTADYRSDVFDMKITAYAVEFEDFIYQAGTGEIEDSLPVFVYQQNDADFVGLDLELAWHVGVIAGGDFDLLFQFDTVDAELKVGANRNLPRLPADRRKLQAVWETDFWQLKVAAGRVSAQREISDFELPSEAYDDVSLYISRSWEVAENPITLFLHGRNLSDAEQRHHTSFVKDFAPAPGRRWELGARFSF